MTVITINAGSHGVMKTAHSHSVTVARLFAGPGESHARTAAELTCTSAFPPIAVDDPTTDRP